MSTTTGDWLGLGIGFPFWLIYVRLVFILRRRKSSEFSTVFYRLVYMAGIADCVGFVINNVINRFPNLPWVGDLMASFFEEPSYIVSVPYCGFYQTMFMSQFCGFILAVNRFCSITFPTTTEQLWRKHLTKIMYVYITVPFLVCAHVLLNPLKMKCSRGSCYFDSMGYIRVPVRNRTRSAIFSVTFSTLTLALNTATLVLLIRRKKHYGKSSTHDPHIRLFIFTMCVFLANLVLGIEQFLFVVHGAIPFTNSFILAYIDCFMNMIDAVYLTPGVLLLVTSSTLRRHFILTFRPLAMWAVVYMKPDSMLQRQTTIVFIDTKVLVMPRLSHNRASTKTSTSQLY